jgi:hypothetical protein
VRGWNNFPFKPLDDDDDMARKNRGLAKKERKILKGNLFDNLM